jgi:TP901 family phage tail tape measure protein
MAIFIPLVTKFDDKGLQGAQRALANFQNFAVDVGRVAAAAVAAVGVVSVREAAQFETSFAKIQGLVGVTADEIGVLEDAAKGLGPAFGVSANEAADALFFITSAGLRGAGATDVLEASLKGAAIGLGDTKTIADLATSAVNAYGESTLGGAEAVDVLAEAVRLGKLAPEELAGSMGQVLPLASNLGVSFAEVGAAMAGMSKTGTDASTAATQLRQILATLAKPTAEANRGLADMGLSAEGLRKQIKDEGLFATLETLTTAFDGNIEATSEVFGNIRALSGVLDLMGASVDDNRELFNQMTDATGVLDEAFGITSETAEFKFNKAMETSKGVLLDIGTTLLDMVNPHLDKFIAFIQENGPAIEESFTKIYEAVNRIITSEALAGVAGIVEEMWPDVESLVLQLLDLAETLTPIVSDSLAQILPMLGDMAAILDGIAYFTDEVINSFGDWDLETDGIVEFITRQINPMQRLADTLRMLRETIDNAREAWERFKGAGGLNQLEGVVSTGTLGGRRAAGGPVSGGSSYLVGERGPEIFTPMSSGNIIPNNQLGGRTNITINVNAGMGANGKQLGEQIVTAIKRYERTSGPVFASA